MTSAQIRRFIKLYRRNETNPAVEDILIERANLWVNEPKLEELRGEIFRRCFGDRA